MNRRGFLKGLASALAAPAIVRSGVLMPVRAIVQPIQFTPYVGDQIPAPAGLTLDLVKQAVELMRERNVPPYTADGRYLMLVSGGSLGSRRVLEHQGNRVRFAEQGADGRVSIRREVELCRCPADGARGFDGS